MKTIERFGGWIMNTGWIFGIAVLIAIPIGVQAFTGGRTASVTSKEFVCTATSAVGIEPRCDQYTRIKGAQVSP